MDSNALSSLGKRTEPPAISWLMRMSLERPKLISLAAGFTDNASLPVAETSALLREILRSRKLARAALQYGSTAGDAGLRAATAQRLEASDGLPRKAYPPERLIITHGSQQLLYLVTECLCDQDDMVLVEDPTYFVYLGILQSRGVLARGVPIEHDGANLAKLESILEDLKERNLLPRLKLLYLVTYFQNPSGVTTSLEKKTAMLQLLRRYEPHAGHPIYLLEDAAYRDLRFAGPDVPSALSVERFADRVIYAGTFSKPFATGVRVGYGILPQPPLQREDCTSGRAFHRKCIPVRSHPCSAMPSPKRSCTSPANFVTPGMPLAPRAAAKCA